ncbi:MAG: TrkA family potassium uptake protein [Oscillospiraceae bacterium]|nr:TrkA family potassium uptake protein [Oscillospiraceae bacterium]
MKTVLIIGIGRFGSHLAQHFAELGNEVMIVDKNEENIKPLLPYVTNAQIADCTDEEVLRNLGVGNFDLCFVCIGVDFQSSLEITNMLSEMGAKEVISKASDEIHAKFLLKNGANKVVYPERDLAIRLAERYSTTNALDYVGISEDVSVYEIPVLPSWIGKSIRDLDFRAKYKVNIIAIKKGKDIELLMDSNRVFAAGETLLVVGHMTELQKFLKKID